MISSYVYKNITQHVMITLYIYIHICIHLSICIQLYIHKHHTTCDDNACDNMCCRYCNNITGAFTRATIYFPDPVVTHAKHIVVHIHIFFHIFSSTADLFFTHIYFFQIYIYFQILSSLIQRFSVCWQVMQNNSICCRYWNHSITNMVIFKQLIWKSGGVDKLQAGWAIIFIYTLSHT